MQSKCVKRGQTVMIQPKLIDKHGYYAQTVCMGWTHAVDKVMTTEGGPCGGRSPVVGVTRPREVPGSRQPEGTR